MVLLECPATLGQVGVHLIEEVSLEDGIVSLKVLLFGLVLHVSEVRVVGEVEALVWGKASESFVSLHFVGEGQLHRSVRDDVAVILNCSNVVVKPVNFFQVNSNYKGLWINFFC